MVAHPLLHPEAANSLALAVIASSNAPLLLLDDRLQVVAASASFCRAFDIEAATVSGRALSALGSGEWGVPQLGSLLKATAGGHAEIEAYEMDLARPGQKSLQLILNAQKLDYSDADNTRLLLSILDVTEARDAAKLKDDLLREKAILLQELQHRVANSLQIIASVLMLSARRVQSEETRGHLTDAHKRIMSAASVQKQLSITTLGEVKMRPYLTNLCESLGASMIGDHTRISLEVEADDGVSSADVSVSLGLIVTELVINALKHAFPGNRTGKVVVNYSRSGPGGWSLSVSDDGVGAQSDRATPGLGTSIVEALSRQLAASVAIEDTTPGTRVSITPRGFDSPRLESEAG